MLSQPLILAGHRRAHGIIVHGYATQVSPRLPFKTAHALPVLLKRDLSS
jgi:hypothetical protein